MLNTTDEQRNFSSKVSHPVSLVATYAAFASLNIFLSFTASLGNILILIALHKVTSIHPPTKLLFRCLAVTDLCVGLIIQPLFTVVLLEGTVNSSNKLFFWGVVYLFQEYSSLILCGVSLLTSTAISVDRLLALLLGLRYRHVVTLRRVRALIISFWVLTVAFAWCIFFQLFNISLLAYTVLTFISLIVSAISYAKIYFRLRHQLLHVQGLVHEQQQQQQPPSGVVSIPLNVARYKKTVSAIAWIQLGLFACYPPVCVFLISLYLGDSFGGRFLTFCLSLLYLNSSLNPILYCWKIREVKQAVKDTVRQLNCPCEPN
ncbi:melanocyte-stimulating hormone receptor-like [Stylophora pistillata]|uniref:melanocyte-stimulating hormone receptor-like n=1 Tax=Stylophora pistillata TaxID=50429 RepID=UPI000C03B92E|nr:melanocyte-stimulating hormone receptor-like [Stylophora pistillata]